MRGAASSTTGTRHLVRNMAAVLAVVAAVGTAPVAQAAGTSSRVSGTDRIATSLDAYEKNRDVFTSETVIMTRADQFPDALAAAPLAAAMKAPVLLTGPRSLDQRIGEALRRQKAERVVVVGGPTAVSAQVVKDLGALGLQVERVQGADRFETAEAVAGKAASLLGRSSVTAFVADGRTPYDALVAGALAGQHEGVVVLSAGGTLKPSTQKFLTRAHITSRVGVGSVGSAAANSIGLAQRIEGRTPETTSIAAAKGWSQFSTGAVVASANSWADGLAGSALAGLRRQPLLLVPAKGPSRATTDYLKSSSIRSLTVMGGERTVSAAAEDVLRRSLKG